MVEITEAEIMNTWKNNNVVVSIDTLSYNQLNIYINVWTIC